MVSASKVVVSPYVKHTPKKYNKITDVVIVPDQNGAALVKLRGTRFRITVLDVSGPTNRTYDMGWLA